MPKLKRAKVPLPSQEEIAAIIKLGHQVSGFSAVNDGGYLYLKLACHNGDIGLLSMSPIVADYLLQHLEKILLGEERDPDGGSPTKWAKTGVREAYGSVFQPTSRNVL